MAQGHALAVHGDGKGNESNRLVRENDPLPVAFPDSRYDSFGRLLISNPVEVFDNKNVLSRNRNQWEEPISGYIITYNTLSGTFQNGEEVRGLLPVGFIAIGTINTDNGSDSMNLDLEHNDFQIGDTVTGQTSGATAVVVLVNTGSSINFNYNRSSVFLSIGDGANDSAVRQTHRYHPYVPDKAHKISNTYVVGTHDTVALVIRSSTSGSPVDTVINRENWNGDKLDGTNTPANNPSGVAIDFTKIQIQKIDFQWLGAGGIRFTVDIDRRIIKLHEQLNANNTDVVFMKTPSLPVRYKIYRSGDNVIKEVGYGDDLNGLFFRFIGAFSISDKQFEEICSAVTSEGGYRLPGLEFSESTHITPRVVTTTTSPVFAIRLKNNFPVGEPNRTLARFLSAEFMVTTNDAHISVLHIHEPVDITATWTDVGSGSGMEYSTDISAFTGRPVHIIKEKWGPTAQAGKAAAEAITSQFINLHGFLSQSFNSDNSQMIVVEATAFTGTADISVGLDWLESN